MDTNYKEEIECKICCPCLEQATNKSTHSVMRVCVRERDRDREGESRAVASMRQEEADASSRSDIWGYKTV